LSASDFLRSELLDEIGVEHGFGTKHSVERTPADVHFARQVHGLALARAPLATPRGVEADAIWTDERATAVGIVTADCVPILIAHQSGRMVCAIHAGWRGSAARIATSTVRALVAATGCKPAELRAAIGPHIGPCCYEIDAPVLHAIPERSVFAHSGRADHALLDLFALNRLQLVGAGVPARGIERVGGCTACEPGLYTSYRRERGSGRMLHFARTSRRPPQ
jgi:hypothetical protein